MSRNGLILVVNIFVIFGLTNGEVQPGLRGVFIYTFDTTFAGSDLQVQEVSAKVYEKILASKEFVAKPKPLASAYEFLNLLDGRCDIQLKCAKQECEKIVQPTCPPKQPCPTCKACPICPEVQQCRLIPEPTTTPRTTTTTTPRTTTTTPRTTTTTPRTTTTTPRTTTTTTPRTTTTTPQTTTTRRTTPPTPKTTTSVRIQTRPPPTYLPPPPSCDNGAKNFPDCCLNGGTGKFCCTNGVTSNEFCCTNGALNKDCALRTITTTSSPPAITTKTFKGPPYIPQPTISTSSRAPFTGTYGSQTYATRTYEGTFPQSRTWLPFTAAPYSYVPRSFTKNTKTFVSTTTPKYARLDIGNGLKYNNI